MKSQGFLQTSQDIMEEINLVFKLLNSLSVSLFNLLLFVLLVFDGVGDEGSNELIHCTELQITCSSMPSVCFRLSFQSHCQSFPAILTGMDIYFLVCSAKVQLPSSRETENKQTKRDCLGRHRLKCILHQLYHNIMASKECSYRETQWFRPYNRT